MSTSQTSTEPDGQIAASAYKLDNGEELKPPTIERPKNQEEEDSFHKAMAIAYRVDKSQIVIKIDGQYKRYLFNGKVIFTDRAN